MKRVIYTAIHRRGLMFVLFLFLAVVGYYAWTRLAIDAYPDISDTTVQVVTQVPGLAAEEIEQQISIPIERAMNGLPGLSVMRSKNTFGLSTVVLVFDDGIDDYSRKAHGQDILKRELETIKNNAKAQYAFGAECDTRHPSVGQVVSQTVGIQHAKDDTHYQGAKRQSFHPVHLTNVKCGTGKESHQKYAVEHAATFF